MHQLNSYRIISSILIVCSIFSLSNGGTMKAAPPHFGSAFGGWNAGGSPQITSTSTGWSGLGSIQSGDAAQSLSLQASGPGMQIGLVSNVASDGYTNLAASGGNSGQSSTGSSESTGMSGVVPVSSIELELLGSDYVNLELDSHAVGLEQSETIADHQAQVVTGGSPGGWGAVASAGGWRASSNLSNSRK